MLRKVVLPEPDGPVTARNSPVATSSVSSRSAWVSTISVRNTLVTFFIVSMGTSQLASRTRGAPAKMSVAVTTT